METKIQTLGVLHARSFSADLDEVDPGDGRAKRRLVVRHPSAVVIIPLIAPDQALVVTQYRYAMGRMSIEFPAGKIDPGETPEAAALRELTEETGYRAGVLQKLSVFAPSVGYSTEMIHIYLARDLIRTETKPDEHEIVQVEAIALARLKEMILAGEIIDGTTMLALAVHEWKGGGA